MKDDYINEIYDECDPIDPEDLPKEEDEPTGDTLYDVIHGL